MRAEVDNSPAFAVQILNGALYARHHHREKKVYTLRNQTERVRTVFVEHPVRDDWELDDKLTPKPDGKSQRFYRYIDDETRASLQHSIDLKARLSEANARVAAIDREIAEIGADQRRLRENIEALTKTAEARQLIARYVQKADQQESRLEQLAKDKQAATEERARLQAQLDAALRTLALERNLAMKE